MRSKLFTLALIVVGISNGLHAQDENGAITNQILDEIRASFNQSNENKALVNAVSHNDIKKLAVNRMNDGKLNHLFSHRVETKAITNQKKSGRCWLYTGLNTLRPLVVEKYEMNQFEFSQTYNFFWDKFEKSNLFLEAIIATADLPIDDRKVVWLFKNPVGDGGQWTTFSDNVKKYGLVPSAAMPDTYQSENTSMMRRLLKRKLREHGLQIREMSDNKATLEDIRKQKTEMLKEIYRILSPSGSFFFNEEPYKNLLHIDLYKGEKKYSEKNLTKSKIRKLFDYFFQEKTCNELEYNIIENYDISAGTWKQMLSIFKEKDIKLESLKGMSSDLFNPTNSRKDLAIWVLIWFAFFQQYSCNILL